MSTETQTTTTQAPPETTTTTTTQAPPTGGNEPWYAKPDLGLSQETKDYLGGKNYGGLEDAFKAKRQFETLARDRNAMPAPQEGKLLEWDGWSKLGWDADATKYELPRPELKDGVAYADGFHDALKNAFHKNKVPPAIAKGVMAELGAAFNADHEATLAEFARQQNETTEALKREWGAKYDEKMELSKRAASAFGVGKEDMAELEDVMASPRLVKMFNRIGEAMGEDRLVTASNSGQGGFSEMGPAQARAERMRLRADPDFVASLTDTRHPMHEVNKAKRDKLIELEARG